MVKQNLAASLLAVRCKQAPHEFQHGFVISVNTTLQNVIMKVKDSDLFFEKRYTLKIN